LQIHCPGLHFVVYSHDQYRLRKGGTMRFLLLLAVSSLFFLTGPAVKAQAQIPPRQGATADKPPPPAEVQAEAPPHPAEQDAAIPPDTCSDQLSKLMSETRDILEKQIGDAALASYISDENTAFGAGKSWKKVHARLKDILGNETGSH
jgi:hypothetical protein